MSIPTRSPWSPVRNGILVGASTCLLLTILLPLVVFLAATDLFGYVILLVVLPVDFLYRLVGWVPPRTITLTVLFRAGLFNAALGGILGAVLGCLFLF